MIVFAMVIAISFRSLLAQADTTGQMLLTEGLAFRVAAIVPQPAAAETLPPNSFLLVLSSRKGARVSVDGAATVDVAPNDVTIVRIQDLDAVATLRADRPFSVTTYQDLFGNGEQAWHLPTYAWGTSYRPFQWWQDSYGLYGLITWNVAEMRILAGESGATVTIHDALSDRSEQLAAYGSTTVQEFFEDPGTRDVLSDPTGRLVTSDHPIAVISGHPKAAVLRFPEGLPPIGEYARPASRSRGNLHDAMLPTDYASTEFVTVPLLYTPTRIRGFMLEEQGIEDDHGDVIRFIALEDSTVISSVSDTVEDHVDTIMDAGDAWYAPRVEQARHWRSNKPVLCAQYGKSFGRIISQADRPDLDPSVDAGQPLLMNVPSVSQWTDHATFLAHSETSNFVNIACRADDADHIQINGRPITKALRRHTVASTQYVSFSGMISAGTTTVHATAPNIRFGVWTYGSLDGLQLGKIYGAVASMDLALPCDDSIVISQETTADSIVFSCGAITRPGSDNDTCAKIAMAYLDKFLGGTAAVSDSSVIVRRATPTTMVDGVVVFVTRSGRYLRRPFHLDGTTSVADDTVSSFTVSPIPVNDVLTIRRSAAMSAVVEVEIHSITGERVLALQGVSSELISIDCSALTPGIYVLMVGSERKMIIVQ